MIVKSVKKKLNPQTLIQTPYKESTIRPTKTISRKFSKRNNPKSDKSITNQNGIVKAEIIKMTL